MKKRSIHINCDLGEGAPHDAALMPFLDACNIACGGHAGNRNSMRETIGRAMEYGVEIGAHPSYPDRRNFGRKLIRIDPVSLHSSLMLQITSLREIASEMEYPLTHIKAHGALYHQATVHLPTAQILAEVVAKFKEDLVLYVPFGSQMAIAAQNLRLPIKWEFFADRNYNEDLSLVSRKEEFALIHEPEEVLQHVLSVSKAAKVKTKTGTMVPIQAETFCIHGDSPGALEILKHLRSSSV